MRSILSESLPRRRLCFPGSAKRESLVLIFQEFCTFLILSHFVRRTFLGGGEAWREGRRGMRVGYKISINVKF